MALTELLRPYFERVRDAWDRPSGSVWVAEGLTNDSLTVFLGCFASETAAWRAGQRARAYDAFLFDVRVFESKVYSDADRYPPAVFLD